MHAGLDHHAHQLLHQQLASVRNTHLADVFARVARLARILQLLQVGGAEQPARAAHMHTVAVAYVEQALFQEAARTVRHHAVALHLSETKTAVTGATLGGLAGQDLSRSSGARVDLVSNHVLKTLVVGRAQEDHDFQLLASEPVVHHFVSVALVPKLVKLVAHLVNGLILERRGVTLIAVKRGCLGEDTLDQVTDCHAGRDSVRVHNHVWVNALTSERQVFLAVSHTACAFLSVARSELVTDLGDLNCAHLDFDEEFVVRGFRAGGRQHDLVDVAML